MVYQIYYDNKLRGRADGIAVARKVACEVAYEYDVYANSREFDDYVLITGHGRFDMVSMVKDGRTKKIKFNCATSDDDVYYIHPESGRIYR